MKGLKNHKQGWAWTATVACAALCLALAPAAVAQEIAQVRAGSGSLDFQPMVEYGALVLTVSGPEGFTHRAEFAASESPAFSIFDASGGLLPDGAYNWELTVAPTQSQRRDAFEANQAATKRRGGSGIEPLVQTGAFSIVNGAVVAGGETEPGAGAAVGGNRLAAKTQVIAMDLIVQGSECVGIDCTSSESFGFDTIRLKENNTRLKFQDTSVGSFPSNDWELTANDSASGGQNRFSILDVDAGRNIFTVEAGAGSNSIYVDSGGSVGGNVGFGTSTPVLDLHVVSGNTPALRLEQNNSSGFAAQTWDVAGNEANFFVRDVTNGSKLPFKIIPNAPTNSLYVANTGNIGIGTASPDADSDVTVNSGESVAILMEKAGAVRFRVSNTTAATEWDTNNDGNGDYAVSIVGSAQNEFEIEQDGDIGNCNNPDHDFVISTGPACTATPRSWIDAGDAGFTTTSSRTVKEHLVPVAPEGIIEKMAAVPVYQYDFVDGPKNRIGLVAEEFHTIFGRGSDREINSHEMQVAMWLAIQELAAENQRLEQEIEDLKRQE